MPLDESQIEKQVAVDDEVAKDPLREHLLQRNFEQEDRTSPFLTHGSVQVRDRAEKVQAERSRTAKSTDNRFNAPVADSFAQWAANPNRYDIPGVDTVPTDLMARRAERAVSEAKELGTVSEVEEERGRSRSGSFQKVSNRILIDAERHDRQTFPRDTRAFTLAHEVGHSFDFEASDVGVTPFSELTAGGHSDIGEAREKSEAIRREREAEQDDDRSEPDEHLFPDLADEQTLDELSALSSRARGDINSEYRSRVKEVTADAFALRRLEPRAVRRDFPKADAFLAELERTVREGAS